MTRAASTMLAVLVLSAPTGAAVGWAWSMEWENTESDRLALAAQGQANCVHEAIHGEDPFGQCPIEETHRTHPSAGTLVLDDAYFYWGAPHPAMLVDWITGGVENYQQGRGLNYLSIVQQLIDGSNTRRDSRGEMAEVMLPGVGFFRAVYGWWDDLDGDGVVEVIPGYSNPGPENEWVAKAGAVVVSYVEPGSRPGVTSRSQPGPSDPDILYYSNGVNYDQSYVLLLLDGSLLRQTTVTTVSEAFLSPDEGGRPYTAVPGSRVDVDVYATIGFEPIGSIYANVLGGISDEYGAPSLAVCPARCEPGPVPVEDLPASEASAFALAEAWPVYPRELSEGSGNTAAGREVEFRTDFHPWIDLLPRTTNPLWFASLVSGPLAGRTVDGEQAMAPGFLTLEAWVGLWKDRDGDGFVGDADESDPYAGGTRPLPDDYATSDGEFVGTSARLNSDPTSSSKGIVRATLVPDDDWGPGGVHPWLTQFPFSATAPTECPNPERACAVEDGPIELVLELDGATLGRYASPDVVYMPLGSPGFTVCTEPLWVRHAPDGYDVTTLVQDCDHIARWMR